MHFGVELHRIEMTAGIGGGPGLVRGFGSPDDRVFGMVGYTEPTPGAVVRLDSDNDGIEDSEDECPNDPEDMDSFEDANGCPDPDNDGDGVPDDRDKCPRTAPDSKVDADGCVVEVPIVTTEKAFVPASGGEILEGVSFVSGSAELTPASISVIVELAATLQADPDLKLEIAGHTDATGGSEANRNLSQRRAESVRRSLIQMGIAPDRLLAVGYGEDFPIADNATAEGRARNRRVEVVRQ